MATCPKGHDSATGDYCDVCGAPMAGGAGTVGGPGTGAPPAGEEAAPSLAAPAEAAAPAAACPVCGTPKVGRFCEEDGYDFLLAPPVPPDSTPVPRVAARPTAASAAGSAISVGEDWHVMVVADRAYFDVVVGHGGEDAGTLAFPRFAAPRRFALHGEQLLIGRRSRSRGVHPDIDLVGPPEDPGVSHLHALLVAEASGWAVVDLESANGTYLNDLGSTPIESNTPVPLTDGDRIYLGAWTLLTVHRG